VPELLLVQTMIPCQSPQPLVDEPGVDTLHGLCMTQVLDVDGVFVLKILVESRHHFWRLRCGVHW
jgi:hypothetical protein